MGGNFSDSKALEDFLRTDNNSKVSCCSRTIDLLLCCLPHGVGIPVMVTASEALPHPAMNAFTDTELQAILRKQDDAVVVLPRRIFRRVVWQHRGGNNLGFHLLKQRSYILSREELRTNLDDVEANEYQVTHLPGRVILLSGDVEEVDDRSRRLTLKEYWRELFRCRLRITLEDHFACCDELEPTVQKKIEAIGRSEFAEIEFVVNQENPLARKRSQLESYILFVTQFFELQKFAPHQLSIFFPGLKVRSTELPELAEIFAQDVDAEAIFQKTRPDGQPNPNAEDSVRITDTGRFKEKLKPLTEADREKQHQQLQEAEEKNNHVRAAIIFTRLANQADTEESTKLFDKARGHLRKLADRLQSALNLTDEEREAWYQALLPVLPQAAGEFWTVSARLLFDLKKVCLDYERPLYNTNLARWLFSFGKKPLNEEQPARQAFLPLKHLRSAFGRIPGSGLTRLERDNLETVFHHAIHRMEARVRTIYRKPLREALQAVEVQATNLPEKISLDKLREELLDRLVERGNLTMSDLRDAIARNRIKLENLAHPAEFLIGDTILRLNRELAKSLPGVYRPGEFYLRWLQSFTSLAFGTRLGRWLTLNVAVPFGGAFVALKGMYYLYLEALHLFGPKHPEHIEQSKLVTDLGMQQPLVTVEAEAELPHHVPGDQLTSLWSVGLLGLFVFLLMHSRQFRWVVGQGFYYLGKALYQIFVRSPRWLLKLPIVQAVLNNRYVVYLFRLLFKPLLTSAVVLGILYLCQVRGSPAYWSSGITFGICFLFFMTRIGRITDEILSNWLTETVHRFSFEMVPIVLRAVLDFFKTMVSEIERYIYSIDEWLSFQKGGGSASLAFKAVFGLVWSVIAFVIRFLVVLIIEPTVNPIKHFPVVTVAGKLMIPISAVLFDVFEPSMGKAGAGLLASSFILTVPGVFGFLVWELKENWRLYKANSPENLTATRIGHHGETMLGLLRPGFHSGTVPSLYRRWRKAARQNKPKIALKCHKELAEVEHAVHNFVDRSFVHLLEESGCLPGFALSVHKVHILVNRVIVHIHSALHPDDPLIMVFDLRSRWLIGDIRSPGWMKRLETAEQKGVVTLAWKGLSKHAQVDIQERELRR